MGISCCAMLILCLNHIGELLLFSTLIFICLPFYTLKVLFLFLGACIVCFNNLKSTAYLVLWFPDKASVCTYPWHQNDLTYSVHGFNFKSNCDWRNLHNEMPNYLNSWAYKKVIISVFLIESLFKSYIGGVLKYPRHRKVSLKFFHNVGNYNSYDWPSRYDIATVKQQYIIMGPLKFICIGLFEN